MPTYGSLLMRPILKVNLENCHQSLCTQLTESPGDSGGGGMVIYNVSAPEAWSFDEYNRCHCRTDCAAYSCLVCRNQKGIKELLKQQHAKATTVSHAANRCAT